MARKENAFIKSTKIVFVICIYGRRQKCFENLQLAMRQVINFFISEPTILQLYASIRLNKFKFTQVKKILILAFIISLSASCKKENLIQPKKQIKTYKEKLKTIIEENCGVKKR